MSTVSVLCAGGVDPTAFVGDVHYVGVLDPGFWMLPLENVAVRLMLPIVREGSQLGVSGLGRGCAVHVCGMWLSVRVGVGDVGGWAGAVVQDPSGHGHGHTMDPRTRGRGKHSCRSHVLVTTGTNSASLVYVPDRDVLLSLCYVPFSCRPWRRPSTPPTSSEHIHHS
jgi:hypothetical protein